MSAENTGRKIMLKKIYASICLLLCSGLYAQSSLGQNVVTDWSAIIQPAVVKISDQNPPRPPTSSEVLNTIIQLAMYDAAMAIEGGYTPYAASIPAPPGADVRAAVATAAYRTARARVAASQVSYLDAQYDLYMANIPDGQAKIDGTQVGESAAAAMVTLRANDGFDNVVLYQCSSDPPPAGEFEPNAGCGTQPVDAKLSAVRPFTFTNPSQFRPDGPNPLTSKAYMEDFIELAISRGLSVRDTARLFAMVHCSVADAVIAGFEAKYFYRSWRPRTAIPRADTDGNPDTDPDPSWTPLLTVNHPEYPSAHGFFSTALTDAVAAFFGTNKVTWTLTTSKTAVPQLVQNVRTYYDMNALMRDVDDARVWAGLHWRHSMHHGDQIGRKVARYVTENFFRPLP